MQNSPLESSCVVVVALIENYNTSKPLNASSEKSHILNCDTAVLWHCCVVTLLCCDIVVLWHCRVLTLLCCDTVGCDSCVVTLLCFDTVVFWHCCVLTLLCCDTDVFWHCCVVTLLSQIGDIFCSIVNEQFLKKLVFFYVKCLGFLRVKRVIL